MNEIGLPPLDTAIPVDKGQVFFKSQWPWATWLNEVWQTLKRPTVTATLTFGLTAAQSSSDQTIAFPVGTVALTDFPVLAGPVPPVNTCYTCFVSAVDTVKVRFNNYSSGGVTPSAAQTFTITVLNQ